MYGLLSSERGPEDLSRDVVLTRDVLLSLDGPLKVRNRLEFMFGSNKKR